MIFNINQISTRLTRGT